MQALGQGSWVHFTCGCERLVSTGTGRFAEQFEAQIANAGAPSSEHAVHFCLALGFQTAFDFAPGSIVFEWPVDHARIDLRVSALDLAIEVKFRRPIPSGRNLPVTQLFGDLLADFNKLAYITASTRMVLYVSDSQGFDYLYRLRSRRRILPMSIGESSTIVPERIATLPQTAAMRAVADGPWQSLTTELVWTRQIAEWYLLAWLVLPVATG